MSAPVGSITKADEPNINRFFSGNRFPLATPSSIEFQMFFFGPSLLVGRLFVCAVPERKPGVGLDVDIV